MNKTMPSVERTFQFCLERKQINLSRNNEEQLLCFELRHLNLKYLSPSFLITKARRKG